MFCDATKISDIRSLFGDEEYVKTLDPERKSHRNDLMISIGRYNGRTGRGSQLQRVINTELNLKPNDNTITAGISYIRAFDFIFYLVLSDNGNTERLKDYAKNIRGVKVDAIKANIFSFFNVEKENKDVNELIKNISFVSTDTKDETLEGICERIENITFANGIELGSARTLAIKKTVNLLYTPLIDRYLATEGLYWCREERQIALFLYNTLYESLLLILRDSLLTKLILELSFSILYKILSIEEDKLSYL